MTGLAHRTISSTAVVARPSKSAIHAAFWSGLTVSWCMPWEMALRVVSLPATTRRTKNGPELVVVKHLAVDVGVDQRRGQVVGGVLQPLGPQLLHQLGQLGPGGEQGRRRPR